MKMLLLFSDIESLVDFLISYGIAFIVAVLITRWVFGIDKIISSLRKQNEQSAIQIRLLKKMLSNQGTTPEEIEQLSKANEVKK